MSGDAHSRHRPAEAEGPVAAVIGTVAIALKLLGRAPAQEAAHLRQLTSPMTPIQPAAARDGLRTILFRRARMAAPFAFSLPR
jgi:hypothetical protein